MNKKRQLTPRQIDRYIAYLASEERSKNTIEKYRRDVTAFLDYLKERKPAGIGGRIAVNKSDVTAYRESLKENYKVTSINSMIVAINGFLKFAGYDDCTVKILKVQKQLFKLKEEMLEKDEYFKLIAAADETGDFRIARIMETICSTGIRISELEFITVEAAKAGSAEVINKGKHRSVIIPEEMGKKLLRYAKSQNIRSGSIFMSSTGKPLDRSVIWRRMKEICKAAGVEEKKVYPHNLRHLFAMTFYRKHKDLAALANILGHSNTETTRIYVAVCSEEYKLQVESIGLNPPRTRCNRIKRNKKAQRPLKNPRAGASRNHT